MFISINLTFSLFCTVLGSVIPTWDDPAGEDLTWEDLPENLPDIWGSFPPYWTKTCTETMENNKFKGWTKAWFLRTMIKLSIQKPGHDIANDYGKILGNDCCVSKGVNGEGGFNVQRLVGYASDSYRVYALCKPDADLLKEIREMNPNKQISKKARIPIIQYYWSMRAMTKHGAMRDGKCELRTGCSIQDVNKGQFDAKKLFSLLDLENVNKLSGTKNLQGAQELFGCMKYMEEGKIYSCT